jgi:hypothetical protein
MRTASMQELQAEVLCVFHYNPEDPIQHIRKMQHLCNGSQSETAKALSHGAV